VASWLVTDARWASLTLAMDDSDLQRAIVARRTWGSQVAMISFSRSLPCLNGLSLPPHKTSHTFLATLHENHTLLIRKE
jgi:hypothetical protein